MKAAAAVDDVRQQGKSRVLAELTQGRFSIINGGVAFAGCSLVLAAVDVQPKTASAEGIDRRPVVRGQEFGAGEIDLLARTGQLQRLRSGIGRVFNGQVLEFIRLPVQGPELVSAVGRTPHRLK